MHNDDISVHGKNRRKLLLCAAGAAIAPMVRVQAQPRKYPAQPITVIVPFSPGGNIDITTRIVTKAMAASMGATFIVNNRGGAGGLVGLEFTARAKPDGYTLVTCGNGSYAITPKLAPGKTVSPSDFAPVGMMTETPMVIEVPATSRFKSFAEFVAYARANPGKLSVGHAGVGTTNQVAILQLEQATGAKFIGIPYKGSAPGLADLAGGQIDAFVDQIPSSLPLISSHKILPLAVFGKKRIPRLPHIPATAELGVDVAAVTAACMLAPAGTPSEIVGALNAALNAALGSAEVKDRLADLGSVAQPMTLHDISAFLKHDDEYAASLIKKGLIKRT